MAKPTSDHIPCLVSIDTVIPKAQLFRFENFWVHQRGFFECVKEVWEQPIGLASSAAIIARKLKLLRVALKHWKMSLSKLKLLIDKCNLVILFFDNLEEVRALFIHEFNFRKIVQHQLQRLLKSQHNYWKKRCIVRWMKMGEENTKFFHAMATERYRRNNISSLKLSDGHIVTDHDLMAAEAWTCYKGRMGTSVGIQMRFDLQRLIPIVDGLDDIVVPFTIEEMDAVVKSMPPDKAPGPDGFNGFFMKKCWSIIKED
ncbi:uncharacterized protein [Lolium perenne]|uniref:uncharacterized protein n=1 Tax=Lolium perenne TaxID=4522 RepID=UPI003A9995B3